MKGDKKCYSLKEYLKKIQVQITQQIMHYILFKFCLLGGRGIASGVVPRRYRSVPSNKHSILAPSGASTYSQIF